MKLRPLLALLAVFFQPAAAQDDTDLGLSGTDVDMPVSIKALMISVIDPAAHYLWDFADPNRELGDEQWVAAAHVATQLAAAGPMIRLGGTGEEDRIWVLDRAWVIFARAMQSAALSALEAAQMQDKEALARASERIVDACDGCHQAFKPSLDPEGRGHDASYEGLYQTFPRG